MKGGAIIGAAECFEQSISTFEHKRRKTAIRGLVCLDEVTGAPSKASIEAHVRERIALFEEHRADFGMLLLQVDQVDHLRVTRGPGVIPCVLRVASHTIENSLRPTDALGAWSDDRFLVVLGECQEADLETVANRIRKMVSQSEVEWWGDRFSVTVAVGGAGCRQGDTLESLVERADRSLAEVVAAGGNRVAVVA
jgi:diguanylate cyclase